MSNRTASMRHQQAAQPKQTQSMDSLEQGDYLRLELLHALRHGAEAHAVLALRQLRAVKHRLVLPNLRARNAKLGTQQSRMESMIMAYTETWIW